MLNKFCITFLALMLFAVNCFAEPFPEKNSYELIDIGILGSDKSEAFGINERRQVLGYMSYNGQGEVFLWEKDSGLQPLQLPKGRNEYYDHSLHLNDKGQIAGICLEGIFIWDKEVGAYNIGFGNLEDLHILGFNNQGQVLINSSQQAYDGYSGYRNYLMLIWDQGEVKNISNDFALFFPEYNRGCSWGYLNDEGNVVINAHRNVANQWTTKSFLWTSGKFIELFKEYGSDKNVHVSSFDNNGNMVVNIEGFGECFFSSSKKSLSRLSEIRGSWEIINSTPQSIYCLPSVLKKDANGIAYYTPGLEIRKLIQSRAPYWTQDSKTIHIKDQNSKGYVVGSAETMYLGSSRHAFLAIPSKAN